MSPEERVQRLIEEPPPPPPPSRTKRAVERLRPYLGWLARALKHIGERFSP
jgi:hypothetical protein